MEFSNVFLIAAYIKCRIFKNIGKSAKPHICPQKREFEFFMDLCRPGKRAKEEEFKLKSHISSDTLILGVLAFSRI